MLYVVVLCICCQQMWLLGHDPLASYAVCPSTQLTASHCWLQRQPITFQKTTVATANNRLRIQSEARTARFGEPSAEDAANAR